MNRTPSLAGFGHRQRAKRVPIEGEPFHVNADGSWLFLDGAPSAWRLLIGEAGAVGQVGQVGQVGEVGQAGEAQQV